MKGKNTLLALLLALAVSFGLTGCEGTKPFLTDSQGETTEKYADISKGKGSSADNILDNIPEYSDSPYVTLYGNKPLFTKGELTTESFEHYSPLDSLGRCGAATACIGQDLMPTEPRESISAIHPTGWVNNDYEIVDGGRLYNRCHLIAFMLTGENANERNLITGTRYMNTEGMLPFENAVAQYIRDTDNHVMYRVTPIFSGDNLVASGVQMEAISVEDRGRGVCFNVYVYNVQPDIYIDYATGDNWIGEWTEWTEDTKPGDRARAYILNTNTMKFHTPDCDSIKDISPDNRKKYTGTRNSLISQGYKPCGRCSP